MSRIKPPFKRKAREQALTRTPGRPKRALSRALTLALLLPALFSCVVAPEGSRIRRMTMDAGYLDPHTGCANCHGGAAPGKDSAPFPADIDPARYCLRCHDYAVNHHPVGVAAGKPLPAGYPLFRGELTCLTCHEIHGGAGKRPSQRLLRGGPYQDRRRICFDCHSPDYDRFNPHRMLNTDGSVVQVEGQAVCLTCHELKPDPTKDDANSVLFRADVAFLCWRCHPLMHGPFLDRHFLVTPAGRYLDSMNRPEVRQRLNLPLVPRGRITCSTCHNPHQVGVLSSGPAAAGAGAGKMLRDQDLCGACHNI